MFSPWTPLPKHIAALAERFDDSTFPSIPPGAAPLIPEFSLILGATEHLSFAAGSPRALCLRATAQLREAPSQTHLVFLPFMPVAPGSAGQKCRLPRLRNFRDANTGGTNLIFLLTWLSSFFLSPQGNWTVNSAIQIQSYLFKSEWRLLDTRF